MAETKQEPQIAHAVSTEASNKVLFLIIGFLLGFIVGFIFTNSKNVSDTNRQTSNTKPSNLHPVSGTEDLPTNHPKIEELETQIKQAVEFGNNNQDYDSQMKVGSFLYLQAKQLDIAKPFLIKAQQLNSSKAEPLVLLGNLSFDLARQKNNPALMQEAISWYEKSLKLNSDDLDTLTDVGIAYQYCSPPNHTKALEFFDKTLTKNPNHIPALYNRARSYIQLKNLPAAQETLRVLKTLGNNDKNDNFQDLIASLEKEIQDLGKQ